MLRAVLAIGPNFIVEHHNIALPVAVMGPRRQVPGGGMRRLTKRTGVTTLLGGAALLSSAFSLGTVALAETEISTLSYGAYFDFDDKSPKSNGYLVGGYVSFNKDKTHLFEFGYDRTSLDFGTAGTLDQNDITAKYTRFFVDRSYKIGLRGTISEDDNLASDGYVGILGVEAFKAYDYVAGIDAFYSRYDNVVFEANGVGQGVNAYQLSPFYGKYFPTAIGKGWYLQGKLDLTQVDSAGQDAFRTAVEGLVTWYSGPYSLTAKGFVGQRQFFVDTGGFTSYNLADLYKGGVKVEAKYTISPRASVKAAYSWDKREVNNLDSEASVYSLAVGVNF